MKNYLLVDVGQTGTRSRIVPRPSEQAADDLTDGVLAAEDPERYLARVVVDALARHDGPVDGVAAGLSGLHGAKGHPGALLDEWSQLGLHTVVLADDSVTSYLAALGLRPGVVLSVGTGVVAMATGSSGGWARVDGWGHQLGDNGGAYWIGRAGLDSALRVLDGRGPGSALLETAAEVFGDPASLATTLLRDSDRVRRVADFAPHVLALATAHDPVAEQICRDAARHLAETAIAAATRAACGGEQITISWSGALLSKTPVLLKTLRSTLTRLDARCELTPPAGSPLDGVGMLIDLPPQHPLTALTVRASTR